MRGSDRTGGTNVLGLKLVGLCVAIWPLEVEADDCTCTPEPPLTWPDAYGTAPANTRVWLADNDDYYYGYGDGGADPALLDSGGYLVPTTRTTIDFPVIYSEMTILTPVAPLTVGETYHIRRGDPWDYGDWPFEVTEATDLVPPAVPRVDEVEIVKHRRVERCWIRGSWTAHIRTTAGDDTYTVVQIADAGGFNPEGPSGRLMDAQQGDEIVIGYAGCVDNWRDAGYGESIDIQLGAFDVAGNFSGWSEPETITMTTCECRTDATTDAPRGLFVLFSLARRRRSSSAAGKVSCS